MISRGPFQHTIVNIPPSRMARTTPRELVETVRVGSGGLRDCPCGGIRLRVGEKDGARRRWCECMKCGEETPWEELP